MIRAVTGKLGAGKSLFCAIEIFDHLCAGRTVVTNMDIVWEEMCLLARKMRRVVLEDRQLIRVDLKKNKHWQKDVVFGARDCFVEVYLDEIHLFFNSRDWSSNATEFKMLYSFLTQSRKAAVNITLICQEESTFDKQMRVQCQYLLYLVNSAQIPLGPLGRCPFNFFIAVLKDAKEGYTISKKIRGYDKRYFKVYESFEFLDDEMIELASEAQRVERIKLRKVPVHSWLLDPYRPLARRLRDATRKFRGFVSPPALTITPNGPPAICDSSSSLPSSEQ